jgi:integrase
MKRLTMVQRINRLSDRRVQSVKTPGRHADGRGLYLVVDKGGAKRWVFMSWKGGRQIEIGLGGLNSISLSAARKRAADCQASMAEGRDPREAIRGNAASVTFGAFSDQLITSLERGWRNDKHRQQWRSTLATYAAPIRAKSLDAISTEDVLEILQPIWTTKAETASRVRGRIEKVLDAAKAKGLRTGENPARWRGHLDHLLPRRQKLQRGHYAAMPWSDLPQFVKQLGDRPAVAALACEFLILTAARSGEILRSRRGGVVHYMRWDEVDFDSRIWTVPAIRMKAGVEHRVPLSGRAIEILDELRQLRSGDFVFPSPHQGKPLSEGAIAALLRRMGITNATPHGFRSSFRDWVGECTSFPREIAEMALAHTVGDQTERAYRCGDALERRRELMAAWAKYISEA